MGWDKAHRRSNDRSCLWNAIKKIHCYKPYEKQTLRWISVNIVSSQGFGNNDGDSKVSKCYYDKELDVVVSAIPLTTS